ncbi:Alpha-amylase precursor [Vibrio thalassae]|uniref:Alpha-amylase n=1 Tax=Vibrio thalassae TaxID=1243014 RepID=A0A240EMR5_9VIBR|nr:alpha-amylase [Vibrio thalassae]SNX49896.1 Alpha-amylase precursor [Vibrio thalassae]
MTHKTLLACMLLASPSLFASPYLTISTSTTSRDYPLDTTTPLIVTLNKDNYQLKVSGIDASCDNKLPKKVKFNTPLPLLCGEASSLPLTIRFTGDYSFVYDDQLHTLTFKRQPKKVAKTEFKRPIPKVKCEVLPQQSQTISLGNTYPDGTKLKDVFTGQVVTVESGNVSLQPNASSGGLTLLELAEPIQANSDFNYRNANIYFVMVDRFKDSDPEATQPYGRQKDGKQEIGTFHGGDLKGITGKLDYIKSLGTNVIWLSPIVEQVHGFVGGGDSGSFPFYAYHGYWARDFTKIDESFGDDEDLRQLVTEAHKRGMKVLLDAVINHPGYSNLADIQFDHLRVVKSSKPLPKNWSQWIPKEGENWHSYHTNIDYHSQNWINWWGSDWIRTGLPGYDKPGSSDTTLSLAGLPDFKTESTKTVQPPPFLLANPGTRVVARDNYTVADYLIEWQTDWVKRFGIDGYRVDTVKHVEGDVWKRLKAEATTSLEQWRSKHNVTGHPFWMMGEVWGHSAYRSPYFDDGFDALINFDMQKKLDKGAACFSQMAKTYQHYADEIQRSADFNPVSYMSSHDTELFFSRFKDYNLQRNAANALLLSPGAIQIYYGDEIGRNIGPYADDFHQGTRSDMIWDLSMDKQKLLEHWKTIGQFRDRHPAVGAGKHTQLENDNAFAFSRELGDDKVVIVYFGK